MIQSNPVNTDTKGLNNFLPRKKAGGGAYLRGGKGGA